MRIIIIAGVVAVLSSCSPKKTESKHAYLEIEHDAIVRQSKFELVPPNAIENKYERVIVEGKDKVCVHLNSPNAGKSVRCYAFNRNRWRIISEIIDMGS